MVNDMVNYQLINYQKYSVTCYPLNNDGSTPKWLGAPAYPTSATGG